MSESTTAKGEADMKRNGVKKHLAEALYERQVGICKAFANPTRLRILDLVAHGPQAATDLHQRLAISKANLSQHLAILKAAGVLSSYREGKRVYCELAIPEVKQACALVRDVLRAQIRKDRDVAA